MTIFFSSRTTQRAFASKNGKRVDQGSGAGNRRWAFVIQKGEK